MMVNKIITKLLIMGNFFTLPILSADLPDLETTWNNLEDTDLTDLTTDEIESHLSLINKHKSEDLLYFWLESAKKDLSFLNHLEQHLYSLCSSQAEDKTETPALKKATKTFVCQYCDKCYYSKHALQEHTISKHGDGYVCPQCDKQYGTKRGLREHIKLHINFTASNRYSEKP